MGGGEEGWDIARGESAGKRERGLVACRKRGPSTITRLPSCIDIAQGVRGRAG